MTIYTIGHSNKSEYDLARKLKKHNINLLVDVRSVPFSSYNPQFNQSHLETFIKKNGINYIWKGKNLGGKYGKKKNVDYDKNIDWILETSSTTNLCILCSEGNYKSCHRHQMLEPDLIKKSKKIINFYHISWGNKDIIYAGKKNQFGQENKSFTQEQLFKKSENGVIESTSVFQMGS
jgi:hypothetical protein